MSEPEQYPLGVEVATRAIIRRGDSILALKLHTSGETYHLLPGGHVENGEPMEVALRRELDEELGVADADIGAMVCVAEEFFARRGHDRHELHFCFKVSVPESVISSQEAKSRVVWVPLDQIPETDLRPRMIRDVLPEVLERESPLWVAALPDEQVSPTT